MAESVKSEQQAPRRHYYHETKWRMLAEAPWLVITLILTVTMFFRIIIFSGGAFSPEQLLNTVVPNTMVIGFLVIPMIIIVASGDADLSAGALAGVVSWIVALLTKEVGMGIGIITSLLVALGVGLVNGLLVGLGKLKGIIVTLAMSFLLSGVILLLSQGRTEAAPPDLDVALARSPLIILLWLLLVIGAAALMMFTPLGRRPRSGDPEQDTLALRLLYRGLPFVFSSFMAWISGILLLSWVGYATLAAGTGYVELALSAVLLGGTAYYTGTGFVLSGAIALVSVILFQHGNMLMNLPSSDQKVMLGILLLIMLPIAHYYHVGVDWLYQRQTKDAEA